MRFAASIRSKVWMSVLTALFGYLIATLTTTYSNARLAENLAHLRTVDFPLTIKISEVFNRFKDQSRLYEDAFLTGEPGPALQANAVGLQIIGALDEMAAIIAANSPSDLATLHRENHANIVVLRQKYSDYFSVASRRYPELARSLSGPEQEAQIRELARKQRVLLGQFEGAVKHFIRNFEQGTEHAGNSARRHTRFLIILFCSVLVAAAFIINRVSNRLIIRPLASIQQMVRDFARGKVIAENISAVDPNDEIAGLGESFRKMTAELRQTMVSKNYVDNIIASMSDSLLVTTPDGVIRTVNHTTLDLLGYAEEELTGRHISAIIDEEGDPTRIFAPDRSARLTESLKNLEKVYVAKTGKRIPVLFSLSVMGEKDGTIDGIVCIARDITGLKEAERALRESERHLKNVLDSIHAGIIIIDPDTHIIVDANAHALKMIGGGREEVVGHACHRFICPATVGKCPITDLGETMDNSERILLTRSGKPVQIAKSVVPVTYEGRQHFIESFVDISAIKRAEQDLKEINNDLKNFASIMSHDLRAPLVNIMGFSQELRRSLDEINSLVGASVAGREREREAFEPMRKDMIQSLEFIGSAAVRMDAQITAILALSRAGRRELSFEPVDTEALVRFILKSLAHQVEERGTTVTIEKLPVVTADKTALEQIFGNLLDNALKYLDPARPGEIAVHAESSPLATVFFVKDNGRGIAKQDLQKVFELFRRSGKQDVRGEGMGLAYVKTLVRRHGGTIRCESELGAGTTVIFTIASGNGLVADTQETAS